MQRDTSRSVWLPVLAGALAVGVALGTGCSKQGNNGMSSGGGAGATNNAAPAPSLAPGGASGASGAAGSGMEGASAPKGSSGSY